MSGGSSALDNINRIRKLEKELELKAQQAARYEAQISDLKLGKMKMGATMAKPGPVLSRTGSVERSLEDQILKDLQVYSYFDILSEPTTGTINVGYDYDDHMLLFQILFKTEIEHRISCF